MSRMGARLIRRIRPTQEPSLWPLRLVVFNKGRNRSARSESVDHTEKPGGVVEVVENRGGGMDPEFVGPEFSRGHRDGLRADHLAAFNVVGRVADDEGAVGRELSPMLFAGAPQRMRTKVVPPGTVVGIGAKFEIMPDLEMREF